MIHDLSLYNVDPITYKQCLLYNAICNTMCHILYIKRVFYLISGDLTDHESCVDELMDYHGSTSINVCIDWSRVIQERNSSAFERDLFDPINFHVSENNLDTLGSKCR